MQLHYDYPGRRAVARVLEGLDANVTFLRLWEAKREYRLEAAAGASAGGKAPACQRAFLSAAMPVPGLPADSRATVEAAVGAPLQRVNGRVCREVHIFDGGGRQRVYVDVEHGVPLALVDEFVDDTGAYAPLATYAFEDLVLATPPPAAFELPPPLANADCERHMGGWPSLHLFHTLLRV